MSEKETKELTGYPSIDKPWLSYYSQILPYRNKEIQNSKSIFQIIKEVWKNQDDVILKYYGEDITVETFFSYVESVANAMHKLGIKEYDFIMASLEAVPEYIYLLLACEMIGCTIKNYIGSADDIAEMINADNIQYYFAPDYISEKDADTIYDMTKIKSIIVINPLQSVKNKNNVRENIKSTISVHNNVKKTNNNKNMYWYNFLKLGEDVTEKCMTNCIHRRLFCSYTSGTTGKPKEVIHSSEAVLGIVRQLILSPSNNKGRDLWLLTILPPTLVAVVISMICYPLIDGKTLILDPYCDIEDIDVEMMYYKPQCWALVPIFFDVLLESKRIPENYDMSHFKLFGFGAEYMTKSFIDRIQKFLEKHNCKAQLSSGYGQSEGGSDFTVAIGKEMLSTGTAGIPLIDTTISIFEFGTHNELPYGNVGEICKCGHGLMLGYSEQTQSSNTLILHPDGQIWLHTGDYGFMIEQGFLFYLGRNRIHIFPDKYIYAVNIENKITNEKIKEAIIVAGIDREHQGYEFPYLFVIPQKYNDKKDITDCVTDIIDKKLQPEERPKGFFIIDKKPVKKFKTDRKWLQVHYKLI